MHRFKNILCVFNTHLKNNAALEQAVKLAENIHANLTVVVVIDEISPNSKVLENVLSLEDFQAKIVIEHREKLKELVFPWGKESRIKPSLRPCSRVYLWDEVLNPFGKNKPRKLDAGVQKHTRCRDSQKEVDHSGPFRQCGFGDECPGGKSGRQWKA